MFLSETLIHTVAASETDYMIDRMQAIAERPGNPEGIAMERFGDAVCFYSRTMPWGNFNTVKGMTSQSMESLDDMIAFYRSKDRKAQFEIVPSRANQGLLSKLAERGFYQSGFHASMYASLADGDGLKPREDVRIDTVSERDIDSYAAIHCRGTGLADDGIPYVAANNRVLIDRTGWKFYCAYVDDVLAAVGVMAEKDAVTSLTFAATLPEYRNRGLHASLLMHRMAEAAKSGCRLAVSQCQFLSQSHRNMERVGMKLAYVRTTWTER